MCACVCVADNEAWRSSANVVGGSSVPGSVARTCLLVVLSVSGAERHTHTHTHCTLYTTECVGRSPKGMRGA